MADEETNQGPDGSKEPRKFNPHHHTKADELADAEEAEGISWGEVCRSCCCHSPAVWGSIIFRLFWVVFFLYFFILALGILGDGAQVMTGCVAGAIFDDDMNPINGLMIGILATVCLQSSSTTTSIIVSLVGAGAISVDASIYIVMGSNIGTSVTNTIVSMGQLGDGDQLERAFAGATVHDMFNFLSVAVLLPIEVITNFLVLMTSAMVKGVETDPDGTRRTSFISQVVDPLGELLIIPNRNVVKAVANGGSCDQFYPTVCEDPANPTSATCSVIGLIGCSRDEGVPCPSLFQAGAERDDDVLGGFVGFLVGLIILFVSLAGLVYVLQQMLLGASSRIIYKATNINGYLAMVIGCAITVAVQSSSITTSTLTPLVGLDIIRLEQMYPLTLGANIGTTITALMSALVTEGTDALQTALSHLFFNLFGIVIWYPIPFMRRVPMHAATQLGKGTRAWKGFPILYIIVVFFVLPIFLLVLSTMFSSKGTVAVVFASILIVLFTGGLAWFIYWFKFKGGGEKMGNYFYKHQRKSDALETLPYDMHWLQRKITELQEHTQCEPAPQPTIPPEKDTRAALVTVADDMENAKDMVNALIVHTGLPAEEDQLGPNGEDLGRLLHKEKEVMPDVDTSHWMAYQLTVLAIFIVIVAFLFWGIGTLLASDVTSRKGLGGLLAIIVGLFCVYRLAAFFLFHGKENSLKAYKDRKLRQMAKDNLVPTLAQVTADIDQLVSFTNYVAAPESADATVGNGSSTKGEDSAAGTAAGLSVEDGSGAPVAEKEITEQVIDA